MKVLITGFEPYKHYTENASWVVAEKVATCVIEGIEIVTELLPVSFSRVADALRKVVERDNVGLIILLGQSAGCDCIKLERTALNMMDSKSADNDGYIPDEEPICQNATPAYFTDVPIKYLCSKIKERGINVKISNSCGLYVCNRLYYEALKICEEKPSVEALFIHLPLHREQQNCNKPTLMQLNDMVEAIKIIIEYYGNTNSKN